MKIEPESFESFLQEIEKNGGYLKVSAPALVKIIEITKSAKAKKIDVNNLVDVMNVYDKVDLEDCDKIVKEASEKK